jgi:hypothetical protein
VQPLQTWVAWKCPRWALQGLSFVFPHLLIIHLHVGRSGLLELYWGFLLGDLVAIAAEVCICDALWFSWIGYAHQPHACTGWEGQHGHLLWSRGTRRQRPWPWTCACRGVLVHVL